MDSKPPNSVRPGDVRSQWLGQVGRIGLYALLLFFQLNATVAYVGLALTSAVFILQWRQWLPLLRQDKAALSYLALALYILAYWFWAAHEFPATAQAQSTAFWNWMHWLIFIPVAWQIHANWQVLGYLLLALALGVLTRILLHVEWGNLAHIRLWDRTGFGIAETVFSPIAGIVALGFLLLAPRIIAWEATGNRGIKLLRALLWLAGSLVILESLVLSQTRSVWLSAAIGFPLAVAVRYWAWLKDHAFKSAQGLAMLAMIVVAAALFAQKNSNTILQRLTVERLDAEPETITQTYLNQQVTTTTSVGYRKLLWRLGIKRWGERPVFGWGPGSTESLLQQSGDARLTPQALKLEDGSLLSLHPPHLHNLYLELLVRFGLAGTCLFVSIPLWILAGVRDAYKQGRVPWDYACFVFAGWACIGMMVFFDFQIFKFAWRNACLVWAAFSHAVCLRRLADTKNLDFDR